MTSSDMFIELERKAKAKRAAVVKAADDEYTRTVSVLRELCEKPEAVKAIGKPRTVRRTGATKRFCEGLSSRASFTSADAQQVLGYDASTYINKFKSRGEVEVISGEGKSGSPYVYRFKQNGAAEPAAEYTRAI